VKENLFEKHEVKDTFCKVLAQTPFDFQYDWKSAS